MPAAVSDLASPKPVGPASYVTFTGSGSDRIHSNISR